MFNQFTDFVVSFNPLGESRYTLMVSSPGGDTTGTLTLPLGDPVYQQLIKRLERLDTDETVLTQLGQLLFQTLFGDQKIKDVYLVSQGKLLAGQGLRLRLHIDLAEESALSVPWEMLFDPDQPGPMSLLDTPIVRYLPIKLAPPLLEGRLPLKVLLTGAETPPKPDVTTELNEVAAALAALGDQVQITVEPHLTTEKLQHLLQQGFDVWHFIGHGGFDTDKATGMLCFEAANGDVEKVSAMQLGILLNRSGLRLVVLDACEGGKLATDPMRSTAPALIRARIPAVVAMQFTVPQQATRVFAREFYTALAKAAPIDACVTEGRKAVMNASGLRNPDWSIPVVYTHTIDGRLFQLPPEPIMSQLAEISLAAVVGAGMATATPPVAAEAAAPLPATPVGAVGAEAAAPAPSPVEPIAVEPAPATEAPALLNNLPAPTTVMVGREDDIERICSLLLRPNKRLITLTGPAGVGKTRLGLAVAARISPHFVDGVWLVTLEQVQEPERVLTTIAQTLGLKEQTDQPLQSTLEAFLHKRQILIMLDNFEQVMTAAPLIANLLATTPGLEFLITSRAALRLSGENEYPVAPLPLPNLEHLPALPDLAQNPAIALFVDRAQAVKPDYLLTEANAASIAEICTRLDGLPLAIELAAARRRGLDTAGILAQMSNQLDLLKDGPLDMAARQRTMRDAIAWSYKLLNSDQQCLFARLALFTGGCTIAAITAICASQTANIVPLLTPVPDLVQALIDDSLLRVQELADQELRYSMFEAIREYADEQLHASLELEILREQYSHYYVDLAETAEPELGRAGQEHWLERLDRDHDNLRSVLHLAIEQPAPEIALRLSGALWRFWHTRSYLSEGRQWLEQALALPDTSTSVGSSIAPLTAMRAKALSGAGRLALTQGDNVRGQALFEQAQLLYTQLGDRSGSAEVLNQLGGLAGRRHEYAAAYALFEQSHALFRELGDRTNLARTLSNRAVIALLEGNDAAAKISLEESLTIRQELGDTIGIVWSVANLGEIAYRQSNFTQALTYYGSSLALSQKLLAKEGIAVCIEGIAQVTAAQDQIEIAAQLWGAAEALREEIGAANQQAWRLRYEAVVAAARTKIAQAAFDIAWASGRSAPFEQIIEKAVALTDVKTPPVSQ